MNRSPVIAKSLCVMVMTAALLAQTFCKSFLVLDYQWNKDYIARVLCVNRDKPEMKCEGKCYLCKKLKADAKKDQENPERRIDNGSELISLWTDCHLTILSSIIIKSRYPAHHERTCTCSGYPPFIPPKV